MGQFWYHSLFFLVLLVALALPRATKNMQKQGVLLAVLLVIYAAGMIGFFPVPWNSGGDRELYATAYQRLRTEAGFRWSGNDSMFGLYCQLCRPFLDYQGWFLLTALIYCFNHAYAAYRCSRENVFIILLMMISAFSFFSYGVNTLRAGLAASFLLLALVSYKRLPLFLSFLFIGVNIHFSMVIPAIAMVAAKYWNKPRLYIALWGVCVLLSAVAGGFFETIFAQLSPDSRASYLNVKDSDTHYKVGFRINFILYSLLPIAAGYYYIVKKNIRSEFYSFLLNTYILANCFWVLVIRANFSDRFAYLSWFIYPLVLIYPALHFRIWKNQYNKIALIMLGAECFTYLMFLR